jgi:hypothetical protein
MKTPAIVSAAFLLAGIVFTGANATHILGGQITATAVSNQNYSYQIKVTIYSDGTLPALLDFENGQLIWNAPAYGGSYAIAFQVKEWRKIEGTWKEIGYVTRDFTLLVQDTINHTNGGDYITATEKETDQQDIILFPNPTDGQFVLNVNKNWYNSALTIQDMLGRKVYDVSLLSERRSHFDLQDLSSGLYILTLQKGVKRRTFTFVKQ